MASLAFDSSGSRDTSRPPISLHPAFPAVVALWFAALLGLGSMVVPVVLVERVVEATGLAVLVPAASPPLGFTARGLIALAAGLAGAAIGIAIARRVARAHDAGGASRVAKFAKGARRPIDVNEELGGEGLVNGFALPVNRRRALAIAEDDRPSDFLYMAPLPGHEHDEPLAFDERPAAPKAAEEPFELSDAFEEPVEVGEPAAWDHPEADSSEDPPMTLEHEFQPLSPEPRADARQEFAPLPTVEPAAEPLPFSAPSLARRIEETDASAAEPTPAPAPEPQPVRADWSSAPLGELGLVQLVQRLGASLERRREWLATVAPAPAPLLAPAADFEPAPAEEAVQAMAAYFGKPAGDAPASTDDVAQALAEPPFAPVASRPTLHGSWPLVDDEDEADAMPSFTLPLRKAVAPTIAFDDPAPENDDDIGDAAADEAGDSYSSLLAMRNPFAPKDSGYIRIDEPEDGDAVQPTVVFPGQGDDASAMPGAGSSAGRAFDPPAGLDTAQAARSPAAPADTEAALRSALATLQRMSGTA